MTVTPAIQPSISFLVGGGRREDTEEKQREWGAGRSWDQLLHSPCSLHRQGSAQRSAVPAVAETMTIIAVTNVLGPSAVILSRVINTVNN